MKRYIAETQTPYLDELFWFAFTGVIQRLGNELAIFAQHLSGTDIDAWGLRRQLFISDWQIKRIMRESGYQWKEGWNYPGSEDLILDVIDFFGNHAAMPNLSVSQILDRVALGQFLGADVYDPIKWNHEAGQIIYDVEVSTLLANLGKPYVVIDGSVRRKDEEGLTVYAHEKRTWLHEFDDEVSRLIDLAFSDYFDPRADAARRRSAVTSLANAMERVKTLYSVDGLDKKESAMRLIRAVALGPDQIDTFSTLLKSLTEVSNQFTVRHFETNKQTVIEKAQLQFLFYSYLNMLLLLVAGFREVS